MVAVAFRRFVENKRHVKAQDGRPPVIPEWDADVRESERTLNPILRSEATASLDDSKCVTADLVLSPMAQSLWGREMSVKSTIRKESSLDKGFRGIPL